MKQFHKLFFTILFVFAACLSVNAQNRFFTDANQAEISKANGKRTIIPQKYRAVSVNTDELKNFLWSLPDEKNVVNRNLAPIMELPMPNGSSAKFRVWESSIQEPALEAKFPEIRTFLGQGIDDPYATIRFDYTDFGFHAQILSVNGNIYMDPYARGNVNTYISYYGKDNIRETHWVCEVADNLAGKPADLTAATGPCRGTQLYTYRLAVGCTHQYAQAVGGTTPALLHSAIVTTVNRVVGVYEDEVTVRMVLIANNNLIEFLSAGTDPYTGNNDANTLIDESQTIITSTIGAANFDIGHTFSTGGGGLAGLGVVCQAGQKASGITGSPNPVGDAYDIDYVAHEMGHEFGANHTFNSTVGQCGGGNRNGSTAYEVGSGTTIMAYAGICSTSSSSSQDNTQDHSDAFFHTVSFDEISNYLQGGGNSCKVATNTNNNIPVITSMSNNGVSIPISTPFVLTATATDADGDALTYDWEEWDLGPATTWNGGNGNTTSPLFKSQVPKTTGSRSFPSLAYILAGFPANPPGIVGGLKGETLPNRVRDMKFRLTVRDNRAGGGGIVTGGNGCGTLSTPFTIHVAGTTPFTVAIPNGGETWAGGSTQTITWNVAGTDVAPISTANVKITLSTDGGLTYPTVIIASTPNDGTEALIIPGIATTTARVRVEAVGNIFFDISNANFTITAPLQTYNFNSVAPAIVACGADITATITLGTTAQGGFSTAINLVATGNPVGTTVSFSVNPLTPGNSTVVTLNGVNTLSPGTYNVTVTGTAGTVVQNTVLSYTVQPGSPPAIVTQPVSTTLCAGGNATFSVVAPGAGISYQWQVSTGGPFTNIPGATSASYTINAVTGALNNNQYHVLVSSACGGTTTTNNVTLTVNSAPAISAQPVDAAVCAGNSNTFTVTATGAGLTYQWQQSITGCAGAFVNIPGATSSSYTLPGITIAQNGYGYRCIITGTCTPPVTSNCSTLTVTGSVNITSQPSDFAACSGTDATFTVAGSGSGVNYQWQVSTGGPFTNIAGATSATLTIPGVTAALNGNQYQAVLTNSSCTTPSTSAIATLTVNALPAITTQPASTSICVGNNTTFTGGGSGTNISYQWQVSTGGPFVDIPGANTANYTINAATSGMNNNQYHVVVSGTCTPAVTSSAATLTVLAPASIATQPADIPVCENSDASFTVTGAAPGSDLYQWQVSTGGPFTNITGETNATLNLPAVTAAMNGNQYQVLLSNASCPGNVTSSAATLTINTLPPVTADADATSVCTQTPVQLTATGASSYVWTPAGSLSDPNISNPVASPAVDPGNPGTPNPIVYTVTGTDGNNCTNTATVTVTANPLPVVTLTANPSTTDITPGQTVVLTASVTPATFTFTWEKDGVLIPNFFGTSLPVTVNELGSYSVTATDATGLCANTSNVIKVSDLASSHFYIYPNPNNGHFIITYHNTASSPVSRNVCVYDSHGARVFRKSFSVSLPYELISVDLRPAASGVYIVVLYDASGKRIASEKIVVH